MEHKLSKHQLRMLISLSRQKEEAKKVYDEIAEAEKELFAMIIKYESLPADTYQLKQIGDDIILFSEDKIQREAQEAQETQEKMEE